jgi:hypothetical protein
MKRLGDVTDYKCIITDRGASRQIGEIPVQIVEKIAWDRKLDTFGTATVDFNLSTGCDCSILSRLDPLATELHLLRGGRPVFSGPVVNVDFSRSSGFVQARDLSTWLRWRVVSTDFAAEDRFLVDYAALLAEDALLPDNPNINVVKGGVNAVGVREVLAGDYRNVLSEIDELLRTDVDMVVVGRNIYFYGAEIPVGQLPDFTDDDFVDEVRVSRDGLSMANRVYVNGADNLWGVWPPTREGSARYGLKERVFNDTSIIDQESLTKAAKTRYDLLKEPYTTIVVPTGARLSSDARVDVNDLIPGVKQRVVLSGLCFPVAGLFRLVEVNVEVEGKGESVRCSWQPVGSEANSEGE